MKKNEKAEWQHGRKPRENVTQMNGSHITGVKQTNILVCFAIFQMNSNSFGTDEEKMHN